MAEAEQDGEQRSLGMSFGELGMAYHAHELPLGAEDSYRNAETLVPDDARWPYLLGTLLQESGRFEESIEAFQRSLEERQIVDAVIENAGKGWQAVSLRPTAGRFLDSVPRIGREQISGRTSGSSTPGEEDDSFLFWISPP